jgi:Protein of unknown function (DUF2997)
MPEESIEVTIGPDGSTTVLVNGIAGMECLGETEALVHLLGGEIEAQDLTAEAYVDVEQEQQDRLWR